MTWLISIVNDELHIVPDDELAQHTAVNCKCGAHPEKDDESVIVHKALDNRKLLDGKWLQ
jgi:hypothetical protein